MDADLLELGLSPFFTQQLSVDEIEHGQLARVFQVHRSQLVLGNGSATWPVTPAGNWFQLPSEQRATVGDWVVLDSGGEKITRLLERKSIFKRVAPGTKIDVQLMAANIDTLFVVSSCNEDFNESRLERYLALAMEAGVDPVIILTKADLAQNAQAYRLRAQIAGAGAPIELVNALDPTSLVSVSKWITKGITIALAGSSGVGKSTLVNSLAGQTLASTAAIRKQDAKGRHTTTYRELHVLPSGGLLLDLPGIRELKVGEAGTGVSQVFDDIDELATHCRFADCQHRNEPGCAVQLAIKAGTLDERRLKNNEKLAREDARHTATLAEQRQQDRAFGKMIKYHAGVKRRR